MYLRFNHLNKEYALSVENFTATYLYPTAKINTYIETAKYFGDKKENIFTKSIDKKWFCMYNTKAN